MFLTYVINEEEIELMSNFKAIDIDQNLKHNSKVFYMSTIIHQEIM